MPKAQRQSEDVECSICGVTVRSRGLISHIKKCEREEREKREDEEIERIIHREAQNKRKYWFFSCSIHI